MRHIALIAIFLSTTALFLGNARAASASPDPVYIVKAGGYVGLFGRGDEYARFSLDGNDVRLQDPYHALLRPGLGVMVAFADRKDFSKTSDLLADHARWELTYWQSHADRVESKVRDDLAGTRRDLQVTEIRLFRNDGNRLTILMVALAAKEGVFVLSVSPADSGIEPLAASLIRSFILVPRALTQIEAEKTSRALKNGTTLP